MAYKENPFDGFANGTALTTATSDDQGGVAFANVSAGAGGTFTIITTDSAHGDGCLEVAVPSGVAGQFDITDTASANGWLDVYFKLLAYPTVTNIQFPFGFRSSSGALGRVEMSTTGGCRINGPAASTYTSGLSLNTWYRMSILITGAGTASTAVTLNIYLGESATPLYTTSITGATTAAQMDRFRFVRLSNETTAVSARYDTIRQNIGDSTPPGPFVNSISATDSATQSDSTAGAVTQGRLVVDSLTQSENTTPPILQSFNVVDSYGMLETSTEAIVEDTVDESTLTEAPAGVARDSSVTDPAALAEAPTLLDRGSAVTDGGTAGESTSVVLVSVLPVDSSVLSEAPALLEVTLAVNDNAAQSEGTTAPVLQSYNAVDTHTLTDVTTTSTVTSTTTDIWILSDASTLNSGGAISATDSAVQSDPTPVVTIATTGSVDSTTMSESVAILQSFNAADAMNQTESPTALAADYSRVDSWALTDVSSLVINTGVSANDLATTTEVPSSTSAVLSRTDSAALSEAASVEVILSLISDTGFLDEDQTLSVVITSASDTSYLQELSQVDQFFEFVASDSAALGEIAILVESGVDETTFARIRMQFPDLNPLVRITLKEQA